MEMTGPLSLLRARRRLKGKAVTLSILSDDFGAPSVFQPGDRASSSDAVGALFSAHPLGLDCPRLHTARSSRTSASTASARASGSGGNDARILQAPADHAHGVDEADPVRVLPGLYGRRIRRHHFGLWCIEIEHAADFIRTPKVAKSRIHRALWMPQQCHSWLACSSSKWGCC